MIITEPGVYDLAEVLYHSDPVSGGSLSSTTARRLLPPSCPAIARYEREHQVFKRTYDIGSAAHELILQSGVELVEVQHTSWRTNDAKAQLADARTRGAVALLSNEMRQVEAMAAAVRAHPLAGALFATGTGIPEQSVFWVDERTGQWCRAMLDWFPVYDFERPVAVDVKTTDNASPESIRKSVANYGYHQQAAWYLDACESAGHEDAAFLFCFVAKSPPYLVSVVQLDDEALAEGRALNRQALDIWRDCREADVWPGYTDDIETISLPRWALTT